MQNSSKTNTNKIGSIFIVRYLIEAPF